MTAEILIVVPVLARPQNARPLVESVAESAACDWTLLFVCSPDDNAELDACWDVWNDHERVAITNITEQPGGGDYARKIQAGYASDLYDEIPYVLLAADDLRFHPGWDTAALEIFEEFDVGVVGTNDLGNRQTIIGRHSTHPFVARSYIDSLGGYVGGEGQVYFDGYDHQYVDVELCETAQARGCYAHASGSVIEHLHPLWRKGESDSTYRRGSSGGAKDRALYERRRSLWASRVSS